MKKNLVIWTHSKKYVLHTSSWQFPTDFSPHSIKARPEIPQFVHLKRIVGLPHYFWLFLSSKFAFLKLWTKEGSSMRPLG